MSSESHPVYEFGPFRLDLAERLLLREGQPLPLTGRAFETLSLLVRNSGHLVSKEELMNKVWSGAFVEDNNLTVSISTLRKALGESKGGFRYIATVPKIGYRFIADVREVSGESEGQAVIWRAGAYIKGQTDYQIIDSLAVLPFAVDSKDQELEYLSEGVSESIIHNLSRLPELKVMARNTVAQFRGPDIDALEIGRTLRVRSVLAGRIIHLGDRLVVRVELVDSVDGTSIWGEQYTCSLSGLLAVQEKISQEISETLQLRLTIKEQGLLVRKSTVNAEAFRLYLKGRYFWNKTTLDQLEKAIEYFQRAIQLDQDYALAHAGLADVYYKLSDVYFPSHEILPQAKAVALRAVSIDDELAEAHASLGVTLLFYDHDWLGAEVEYKRAIELNPTMSLVRHRLARLLMYDGRFDVAMEELDKALESDPLSRPLNVTVSMNLHFMGRTDEAIRGLTEVLEMQPDYYPAHGMLGMVFLQQNRLDEAVVELKQGFQKGKDPAILGLLGYAYAARGDRSEAERLLQKLKKARLKQRYIPPFHLAVICAGLGEKEQAFEWLEIAYKERNDWMLWLKLSWELRELRSDPRYEDLLRRIGFS